MIIKNVSYGNRSIPLCGDEYDPNSNVFTILVGRNGCGKSTLLQKICLINLTFLLRFNPSAFSYATTTNFQNLESNIGRITYLASGETVTIDIQPPPIDLKPQHMDGATPEQIEQLEAALQNFQRSRQPLILSSTAGKPSNPIEPLKIIAVSSSPFDKFPIIDEFAIQTVIDDVIHNYIYRGARPSEKKPQKSYLSFKFDQLGASLLSLFLSKERRKSEILPLFNYLGLTTKLKLTLSTQSHFSLENFNGEKHKATQAVQNARFFKRSSPFRSELNDETLNKIANSVNRIHRHYQNFNHNANGGKTYQLELDLNSDAPIGFLSDFALLAEYDLIDIDNIEFTKSENNTTFLLTDASSGELCMLFNILSIAGAISDNSIVLIDEPELSLHPEWQRDFLPLISEIFSPYKNCHFIIATHSPQITSSMNRNNSFIVNLESEPAKVLTGEQTHTRSSDFQLAFVFGSPGHKNEYLITRIVDALSKIRDGRKPDESFTTEICSLLDYYELVPENDPVRVLLNTLEKALKVITNA